LEPELFVLFAKDALSVGDAAFEVKQDFVVIWILQH
jgi:hypothetical protein